MAEPTVKKMTERPTKRRKTQNEPPEYFFCLICKFLCYRPVVLPCQCMYCSVCVSNLFRKHLARTPRKKCSWPCMRCGHVYNAKKLNTHSTNSNIDGMLELQFPQYFEDSRSAHAQPDFEKVYNSNSDSDDEHAGLYDVTIREVGDLEKRKLANDLVLTKVRSCMLDSKFLSVPLRDRAEAYFGVQGPFEVMLMDPPWQYRTRGRSQKGTTPYTCPSPEKLRLIAHLASGLLADDAVVITWVTYPTLREYFRLMDVMGVEHKTGFLTWVKTYTEPESPNAKFCIGLGFYGTRGNSEQAMLAVRGKISRYTTTQAVSSVLVAKRRQHSRKPDKVYDIIERAFGWYTRKIELFSRDPIHFDCTLPPEKRWRRGWSYYGNQSGVDSKEYNRLQQTNAYSQFKVAQKKICDRIKVVI